MRNRKDSAHTWYLVKMYVIPDVYKIKNMASSKFAGEKWAPNPGQLQNTLWTQVDVAAILDSPFVHTGQVEGATKCVQRYMFDVPIVVCGRRWKAQK